MTRAARFAAIYALLRTGADLGDHWVQSDHCARTKSQPGLAGRRACAAHCITYTATQGLILAAGARALNIRLHPGAIAAALTISGLTHYAADRRVPGGLIERLADSTGKHAFLRLADHGMNGAYQLDQAWHHACETLAAVVASR